MNRARRVLRRHFTSAGRALLVAILLSAPALLNPGYTHLDVIFTVTLCLLAVSIITGLLFRPKLRGSWSLPSRVACGETPTLELKLQNLGRRPIFGMDAALEELTPGVELEERTSLGVGVLGSDTSIQLSLSLRTSLRGAYLLGPLYAGSTFPFGLSRFGSRIGKQRRLLVTPRIHPIHHMKLDAGGQARPGAAPNSRQTGESMEFIGVREYRQGDSLRKVHWKLLARRGLPVVREYSREYFSRVGLILDTYKPPQPQVFELATEVVASIAHHLSHRDVSLEFLGEGSTLYPLAQSHHNPLMAVLDLLACTNPCFETPYQLLEAQTLHRLPGLSSVIVVTFDLGEERRAFIRTLQATGTPIRVVALAQGESDSQVTYLSPASFPDCLEIL